jgi:hypothetical protein
MLKDMVGAGDALDNPAFALQTALNVAAVGKHVFRTPSPNLSRHHARQGYPATLGIAKTELSIFFRADCTMVTLRIAIFAHLHHAPHRFINRTTSNLRIRDLANCLDESDNSRRALKSVVAVFVKDVT